MFLSSHEYKDCFSNSLSEFYGGKQSDKSWKKCEHLLFLGRKKNPCSVCQSSFAHVVKIFKNNISCTVGDTFKCAAPEMIERNMHFETLVCSVDLVNKKISKMCVIPLHLLHISVSFFK